MLSKLAEEHAWLWSTSLLPTETTLKPQAILTLSPVRDEGLERLAFGLGVRLRCSLALDAPPAFPVGARSAVTLGEPARALLSGEPLRGEPLRGETLRGETLRELTLEEDREDGRELSRDAAPVSRLLFGALEVSLAATGVVVGGSLSLAPLLGGRLLVRFAFGVLQWSSRFSSTSATALAASYAAAALASAFSPAALGGGAASIEVSVAAAGTPLSKRMAPFLRGAFSLAAAVAATTAACSDTFWLFWRWIFRPTSASDGGANTSSWLSKLTACVRSHV